jgi:hypothetical protein
MIIWLRNLTLLYVCSFLYVFSAAQAFADPTLDETRDLLQKGLTIVQLDQEIARLSNQDTQITSQIEGTRSQLVQQDEKVAETRVHAGKVLRAYYMGDRDSIWTLLFSAKSFTDALALYDYLSMIIVNDHALLTSYGDALNELKSLQNKLVKTQIDLREVKAAFITQRERNIALQKEVDDKLRSLPPDQAQLLNNQIDQVKKTFTEKVVPLFERYFAGISQAMPQFVPDVLVNERDKYIKGLTFQVSDTDLIQRFRRLDKTHLFDNINFEFKNGAYSVVGHEGDIEASIKGHYTVEDNPNRLQFHVDELGYNGHLLDDTTKRYMEQKFDLSLSVEKYSGGALQAKEVKTENGILSITLSLTPKKN